MSSSLAALIGPFVAGFVGVVLSIPFLSNKVPRNSVYGFRTKLTLSSDEVWYPANRFAAKALIAWGLLNLLVGVIASNFQPLSSFAQYLLLLPLASIVLVFVICLVWVKKNYGHLAP